MRVVLMTGITGSEGYAHLSRTPDFNTDLTVVHECIQHSCINSTDIMCRFGYSDDLKGGGPPGNVGGMGHLVMNFLGVPVVFWNKGILAQICL